LRYDGYTWQGQIRHDPQEKDLYRFIGITWMMQIVHGVIGASALFIGLDQAGTASIWTIFPSQRLPVKRERLMVISADLQEPGRKIKGEKAAETVWIWFTFHKVQPDISLKRMVFSLVNDL
jgi:hypothetical protein